MREKQVFKVITREVGRRVDYNSYQVVAYDAEDAIRKAKKVFAMPSRERPSSVQCLGELDVA